jgi:hypothetical protein
MKILLVLLLALFSLSCTLINQVQSPTDLLAAFCWKQIQQPGSLDALFNSPMQKCAGYLVCRKVGVNLDFGAQYCTQTGMRGVE